MDCFSRRCLTTILTVLCLGGWPAALQAAEPDRDVLADRVTKLSRGTQWKPVTAVPINFLTHHPQGMVKIGFVTTPGTKTAQ